MSAVLNIVLPVFAIILAGYGAGRVRLLGDEASSALNTFVFWFALPPVLFLGTARRPLAEVLNLPFIAAFLSGLLATYVLGAVLGRLLHRNSAEVTGMQALNACFSNTGYMGIPLFLAAFGAERLGPAILATVLMSAIMVGLAVIVLEVARGSGHGRGHALRGVLRALMRNPLIVSPALGLAFGLLRLPVPAPIVTFGEILGAAAGPCALFAIGLFLAGRPLTGSMGEIAWMTVLKLIVHPAMTWWLAVKVFALDPFWAASAVILAALPTGALTFVIARQYQVYVERTSTVILVSTLVSVVTLSFLLSVHVP